MKTMAPEEQVATRELMDAWEEVNPRWRELPLKASTQEEAVRQFLDFGAERLAAISFRYGTESVWFWREENALFRKSIQDLTLADW